MRVDPSQSVYREDPAARGEFDRHEIKRCRYMLRRLMFLEAKVRDSGGMADGSSATMHAEWEIEALEWLLTEVGFLSEDRTAQTAAAGSG